MGDRACCEDLRGHLAAHDACPMHGAACPDVVIIRTKGGGLGLPIHDGGSSWIEIRFCPWCGTKVEERDG